MSLRRWVERLAPPILADLYRHARGGPFWRGVYPRYTDVPTSGAGLESDSFMRAAEAHVEQLLARSGRKGSIPTSVTEQHSLLPLPIATVCRQSGKAQVLDFGGGMGPDYLHVLSSVPACGELEYHIVETRAVCAAASRLFRNDSRVHFHATLPENMRGLDVVYVSSALQYVEDYTGLLRKLCAYGAQYVLFVKLSSGDIPTYATQQANVPGTTIAYWFLNVREVIEHMHAGGYALIFKGALDREYDQQNFPAEYRLGRACNLLFARTPVTGP